MGRPAALSRERIVLVAAQFVADHGAGALSARRLGETLGCDPSALYRHFANMGDLEREVADRLLADIDVDSLHSHTWRSALRRICVDLRSVQLQYPRFAALIRSAPTRLANELRITEAMLRELARSGLPPAQAAAAYHALIELTVGSAAVDAPLASEPVTTRRRLYRDWRADYAALDTVAFPASVAASAHLYEGSADDRFEFALDLLLDGLQARLAVPRDGVSIR
ncbi:MAG: TetR/AcrR family transcriptional regulator C-terminal domain-containing protein [Actinomycetota bacterium]|nr:TetR/AcrR family transcriptional regulator C-terminal domain-containing protein [Actinomycetota bacterium]